MDISLFVYNKRGTTNYMYMQVFFFNKGKVKDPWHPMTSIFHDSMSHGDLMHWETVYIAKI